MQSRIGRDFIEDILLQASRKVPGRYYFAIFILATTTLSYQILITRFFSVMLYYHFAFAAISLAMLRGTPKIRISRVPKIRKKKHKPVA